MRAEFYGLAYEAIAALQYGLQVEKDARLGYQVLRDTGVIPSPAEAEANATQARQPEPEELTPFERAAAQDESGEINRILLGFARHGQEMAALFGWSEPTVDEVWRMRTVAALLDEMTYGQFHRIMDSDPEERERLKKLAEDILKGKRAMTDKEIVAVRKKYNE
jgi:hypothetical protein